MKNAMEIKTQKFVKVGNNFNMIRSKMKNKDNHSPTLVMKVVAVFNAFTLVHYSFIVWVRKIKFFL